MRSGFEKQVRDLGLRENFLFLGRRNDVPAILACCDIAVLPSLAEGLPNAVLEYLAAGLPVVASALGGNLEIIQDGRTGLLVPPQDSQALAAALNKVLSDEDLADRTALAGHDYVKRHFSFERLVADIDTLYAKLLHRVK
jgi:glycosyltransferase involved in cell wall biosynthesis